MPPATPIFIHSYAHSTIWISRRILFSTFFRFLPIYCQRFLSFWFVRSDFPCKLLHIWHTIFLIVPIFTLTIMFHIFFCFTLNAFFFFTILFPILITLFLMYSFIFNIHVASSILPFLTSCTQFFCLLNPFLPASLSMQL